MMTFMFASNCKSDYAQTIFAVAAASQEVARQMIMAHDAMMYWDTMNDAADRFSQAGLWFVGQAPNMQVSVYGEMRVLNEGEVVILEY